MFQKFKVNKIILNRINREFLDISSVLLNKKFRDLDEILIQIQEKKTVNFLQIQRLKKRKLILKDKINYLKNKIEPDIIA